MHSLGKSGVPKIVLSDISSDQKQSHLHLKEEAAKLPDGLAGPLHLLPDQDGLRALQELEDGLGVSSDDLEVEGQGEACEPVEGELEPGVGGVVPASSRGPVQGGRRPVQWRDLLRAINEALFTN